MKMLKIIGITIGIMCLCSFIVSGTVFFLIGIDQHNKNVTKGWNGDKYDVLHPEWSEEQKKLTRDIESKTFSVEQKERDAKTLFEFKKLVNDRRTVREKIAQESPEEERERKRRMAADDY